MVDSNKIDPDLCLDPNCAETYQCSFCLFIPLIQQYSCSKCQKIMCLECMTICKNICQYRCENSTFQPIQSLTKSKIESIKLKCDKCYQIFLSVDFENHTPKCGKNKCSFRICPQIINENEKKYSFIINNYQIYFCSKECKFAYKLAIHDFSKDSIESDKKLRSIIEEISLDKELHVHCHKQNQNNEFPINIEMNKLKLGSSSYSEDNSLLGIESHDGSCDFQWASNSSKEIALSNENRSAFLKETGFAFRSIVSDKYFKKGIFYWEIIPDTLTENELKVGICLSNNFDKNTSFSDYEFGYAFYGIGQLRHGSNSSQGTLFGKPFKNEGTLGVCLNMDKGTLSFALNSKFLGIAFTDDKLKKGPIYAAISLLHKAGLTLITRKPLPSYFIL